MNTAKVILGASAATYAPVETQYGISVTGVEEFIGGVIQGLIQKDDLPELQKCLKNTEVVQVEVNKIIEELQKGDLTDIVQAVNDAIALIQELPTDLQDCKSIQDDVTKIENWAKQAITPTGLTKIVGNVMANWSTIQKDIGDITTDVSEEKYLEAGEVTADVVVLAMGKISYSEQNKLVNDAILASYNKNNLFLYWNLHILNI